MNRYLYQGSKMRPFTLALCPAILSIPAGCAALSDSPNRKCDVLQLAAVLADPIKHSNKVFCGDVFVVEYSRTTRILNNVGDIPPSSDLALLVSSKSRRLLSGLSRVPQKFYMRARIEPMAVCFRPSESGEECSPYRRPIVFYIFSARRASE